MLYFAYGSHMATQRLTDRHARETALYATTELTMEAV